VNKDTYIDILRRLRDVVRGNASKNGQPTVDFSFTTMLQLTGRFWSRILSKEQCDNTGASPILS